MREYKFRAWDTLQKGYDYDVLMYHGKACYIDAFDALEFYDVGRFVIEQYTGLKDRNGKDIYEGDMIFHYDQNCIIEYDHGAFVLKGLHKDKYKRVYAHLMHYLIDITIPEVNGSKYDGVTTSLEIIGNRFDNPELLVEVRE